MLTLILIAYSQALHADQHRFRIEPVPALMCAKGLGMTAIAEWAEQNPGWTVQSWRCGR
jgi:hypothetical protein